MSDTNESDPSEVWEVIVAHSYDPGDHSRGTEENSLIRGTEAEARRVYADRIAEASERGQECVTLRRNGTDVESWPQATGWTV